MKFWRKNVPEENNSTTTNEREEMISDDKDDRVECETKDYVKQLSFTPEYREVPQQLKEQVCVDKKHAWGWSLFL